MGIFSRKKDDSNSLIEDLRTQNSKLKEELSLMASVKNANEILKKQVQETYDLKSGKEYLIKLILSMLIEKCMGKKNIKVFDDDPVMLFHKLIERFELIDKLSSVTNTSVSNDQESDVLLQEKDDKENNTS